jgi:hypothetical protein
MYKTCYICGAMCGNAHFDDVKGEKAYSCCSCADCQRAKGDENEYAKI